MDAIKVRAGIAAVTIPLLGTLFFLAPLRASKHGPSSAVANPVTVRLADFPTDSDSVDSSGSTVTIGLRRSSSKHRRGEWTKRLSKMSSDDPRMQRLPLVETDVTGIAITRLDTLESDQRSDDSDVRPIRVAKRSAGTAKSSTRLLRQAKARSTPDSAAVAPEDAAKARIAVTEKKSLPSEPALPAVVALLPNRPRPGQETRIAKDASRGSSTQRKVRDKVGATRMDAAKSKEELTTVLKLAQAAVAPPTSSQPPRSNSPRAEAPSQRPQPADEQPPVPPISPEAVVASDSTADQIGWSRIDLANVKLDTEPGESSGPSNIAPKRTASPEARRQAERSVQLGFELIQRRAPYSARARFVEALRTISRSIDDQTQSNRHAAALRRGLTAYDEAADFFPAANRPDEEVNLSAIVSGHSTSILRGADTDELTPERCLREYLSYAEQEFTAALASEQVGSRALYGIARLETAPGAITSSNRQVRTRRALTLHQVAMIVDSDNYAAANELGVLLARYGRLEEAKLAFRHCVRLSPQPTAWKNLANVHRQLGQIEEARLAQAEADRARPARRAPFVASTPTVEWVDAGAFTRTSTPQRGGQAQTPVAARRTAVKTASARQKSFWGFGRK